MLEESESEKESKREEESGNEEYEKLKRKMMSKRKRTLKVVQPPKKLTVMLGKVAADSRKRKTNVREKEVLNMEEAEDHNVLDYFEGKE